MPEPKMRDKGLSYMDAAHAIQSAIMFELGQKYPNGIPPAEFGNVVKHLRVGIDLSKAEQGALAGLLIKKRVFTLKEYEEMMRLAANEELSMYEERIRKEFNLPDSVMFG